MNARSKLADLIGEINSGLEALAKIERFIVAYEAETLAQGRTGTEQALALTQAFGNYYTCIETIFFRISQCFENSLPHERWHQALLEKMAMEMPEFRPAVISHGTRQALLELLRFRHFSRYYYEFEYDWDKLRFLLKKFNAIRGEVRDEIQAFRELVERLFSDPCGKEEKSAAHVPPSIDNAPEGA